MVAIHENRSNNSSLHPSRAISLADGVFAIAMTILVLNFDVPADTPKDVDSLLGALSDMSPQFFNFALAFLLLGIFWISHYRKFHVIERTDDAMLWLNVFTLMFVVLIPFSVSVFGDFSDLWPAALLFEGNLAIVGLLQAAQWEYATRGLRLVGDDYEVEKIKVVRFINLVTPAVSAVAIAIALLFSPGWSTIVYMAIPFILMGVSRSEKRKAAERKKRITPEYKDDGEENLASG